MHDAQDDWSVCVADRGHPYFEFSEHRLNLRGFVATFYEESGYQGSPEGPQHEPPPGAPWSPEEARANEIAFAVDVAECADETGLRKTMETEWRMTMEAVALENKDEIFAWHDSLEEALEAAGELIAE
ncbi:hypothetical protein FB566_3579 [Stackebrandtia endophytica]|uniref:Uncharacterized protein n=1 Tax=Stackebrandtia endophytica TaxID=1496996 RepID=A0A543AZJ7_9ACTN|nr:hypothetical protein [Stackebrandtia endophytica]TQL78004.1 hypothetical protein FB566_3579 [Stackebrandtia endophytica]